MNEKNYFFVNKFTKIPSFFGPDTFLCRMMRRIILCKKKSYNSIKKNSDNLHIEKKLIFPKINLIIIRSPSDYVTFV